jgi:2-polyprenyl-3-methyl-5-hydroxy-6-metoxy-1,4-benzoquinol methylase
MIATRRERAEAFGQTMVDLLNQASLALMASIGHRTGLFDVMASLPPSTSARIAHEAGLSERYVREWLGAMAVGGIVEHDPDLSTYALPPEHAAWLTRSASPNNLAVTAQWIAVLASVEDSIVDAFRHGRGVPYAAYLRFHQVMAEESAQTVVAALHDHILPLVPDLIDRLDQGIDVLDVGCGAGRALIQLASTFPRSRFTGYDLSDEAIDMARAEAHRLGLTNVTLEARDLADMEEIQTYDLVTAFDAIHDQARPGDVLRGISLALRPGGLFLMQDISGSGHLHEDHDHTLGPFLYTISCLHCMSVSLAGGGPGLGAMWGKRTALAMLEQAGFRDVRVETLPHDPINFYYIATKDDAWRDDAPGSSWG